MAPKAKVAVKNGRQVIPNRKMDGSSKEDKKAAAQREQTRMLLEQRAARKMQRYARLKHVLLAMQAIDFLEETVLVSPTPGEEAIAVILAGPQDPTQEELAEQAAEVSSVASSLPKPVSRSGSKAKAKGAGEDEDGSSESGSSSSSSDSDLGPHISEHTLADQLELWLNYDEDEENELDYSVGKRFAKLIFWLLGKHESEEHYMFPCDFERIHRHHRLRRRNENSKIHLYLALVQHGDASNALSLRPSTAGPLPGDGPRPLDPEGWEQVTRIAWAMRLCPQWVPPGLVLSAETECCQQTVERLRQVWEQPHSADLREMGYEAERSSSMESHHRSPTKSARSPTKSFHRAATKGHSDHHAHFGHGHHDHEHHKKCPAAIPCDPLNFPRSEALLGPTNYYVSEAILAQVRAGENPNRNPKRKPKPVTPVFLVAGGTMTETMLATLTASRPREEMITARLKGGDAVLLCSPAMCSITGEDLDEKFRPNSNLWEEALRRDDWVIKHHLRGDGKGQPLELGGIPEKPKEVPTEFKTELTAQWNRYAGTALILSDSQYMDIRKRAGKDISSGLGMDPQLSKALRPIVKDYIIPQEHVVEDESAAHLGQASHGSHRRPSKSRKSMAGKQFMSRQPAKA